MENLTRTPPLLVKRRRASRMADDDNTLRALARYQHKPCGRQVWMDSVLHEWVTMMISARLWYFHGPRISRSTWSPFLASEHSADRAEHDIISHSKAQGRDQMMPNEKVLADGVLSTIGFYRLIEGTKDSPFLEPDSTPCSNAI